MAGGRPASMMELMAELAGSLGLAGQRPRFQVDDAYAYLNTAAMSPLLRSVREAAEDALALRAAPWRMTARLWFDDVEVLRSRAAQLLNATPDDVALVPSSSYGLAAVARNLRAKPGDRVLVLDDEFASNHFTWERFARRTGAELFVLTRETGQSWTEAIVNAVDERTVVLSVPNVHWTNGALVDIERVAAAAHDVAAGLIIDASQSLGVMPLDVTALRPLAVVSVGYKWLLGPLSLAYLYLDPSLQNGEPLEENWIARQGSDDFARMAGSTGYLDGARRFDVGERSNFQLVPMAAAALAQVLAWTPAQIGEALRARTDVIAEAAGRLGLSIEPRNARGPHLIGVGVPAHAITRVATSLTAANVVVSVRGNGIRVAPHLHTDDGDVERLMSAVAGGL